MPIMTSSSSRACLLRSSRSARLSTSQSFRNARRASIAGSRFRRTASMGHKAKAVPNRRQACGYCRSADESRADVSRLAFIAVLLTVWLSSSAAFAHASLVRAEPADGAMLAETPQVLKLTFNEPVSVLVMRLIGPSGEVIAPGATAENNVVPLTPPRLRQGSHVLSWRVV